MFVSALFWQLGILQEQLSYNRNCWNKVLTTNTWNPASYAGYVKGGFHFSQKRILRISWHQYGCYGSMWKHSMRRASFALAFPHVSIIFYYDYWMYTVNISFVKILARMLIIFCFFFLLNFTCQRWMVVNIILCVVNGKKIKEKLSNTIFLCWISCVHQTSKNKKLLLGNYLVQVIRS